MDVVKQVFGLSAHGPEGAHPPLTRKELWGWWWYDWSNSAVSSVIISGFLPLLLQDAAQAYAGFPTICPNLLTNATLVQSLFPAPSAGADPYTTAYGVPETDPDFFPSSSCVRAPAGLFMTDAAVCPGTPGSADVCLYLNSAWAKYPLRVTSSDGSSWDPAAYSNAMNSLSTGLQMLVFVALSGLADFGPYRKGVFVGLSLLGCLLSILCVTIRPSSWQGAGALVVLTSITYMSTYVFYNAWLPLLGANDPAVLVAPKERQDEVFMARMHDISSRGFAYGYLGSVICLLLCVGVTVVLSSDSIVAYGVNCAIAGIWWFTFSIPTFLWLKPRPGPPLPKGANYFTLPWKRLAVTASRARQLPQTFLFLLCWFIMSDGFNVISSVGAIYANTSVTWNGLPKSIGLAALLVITPIFAGIGNMVFNTINTKGWLSPKTIIRINLIGMALVPAYGLLGYADKSLGYRRFWELYIGVIVYGFNLGAVQAFARSAFGAMIPEGLEAQFFSLYNVTDRGSSWIGPAVISAVINSTGTIRLAFIYPLVMLIIPSILLQFVNFPKAELEAKAYAKLHGTAILATRGALSVALAGNTNETGTPVVEAEGGKGAVAPAAPLAGAEGESAGLVESARQAEQQQQQA